MVLVRSNGFIVACLSLALMMSGCGSDNASRNSDIFTDSEASLDPETTAADGLPPISNPDASPVTNSEPDAAPAVVASRLFFELIGQLLVSDAVFERDGTPLPYLTSADGSHVLIRDNYFDVNGTFVRKFIDWDVMAGNATVLPFTPISDTYPAFDEVWTTMAYAMPCDTLIQRPASLSEPLMLGAAVDLDNYCSNRESAQISDDGETVLMQTAVFNVATGTVIRIGNDALQLAAPALATRTINTYDHSLSADGRYVVATALATDGPVTKGQTIRFSAGTVIVDARTGEARIVGLSDYERFVCLRCNLVPVTSPVISGNGRYVFYEQAPEIQHPGNEPLSDSFLYRYDIESGETLEVRADALGISEIVASDSGERVAWRSGSDVQVGYLGSAETISLQSSFRFCTEILDNCLFATHRFVTSEALTMSRDGSGLSIYLIPQQDEFASQRDVSTLLHFNLDTGTLSRVLPNASGVPTSPFHALSGDGNTIVAEGVSTDGVATLVVLRSAAE